MHYNNKYSDLYSLQFVKVILVFILCLSFGASPIW